VKEGWDTYYWEPLKETLEKLNSSALFFILDHDKGFMPILK
jgi:hypothetical protein